jgi:hypothetical protein
MAADFFTGFVMATSKRSSSLFHGRHWVDSQTSGPDPGEIAIWQTRRGFRNLQLWSKHNFTITDSPAKRLGKSMLCFTALSAESSLLQLREYFA